METAHMLKRTRASGLLLIALAAALLCTGCIRRMATITSDPPGAKVWVNGVYRGETPVEIPYSWNWFYDMRLEKGGYEPYSIRERFYAAPQHRMPVDLVTEMSPVKSHEAQWRHYTLTPKREL
jgi:hypothetical protein